MRNYETILETVDSQEKELQFNEFTNNTALTIGNILIDYAKKDDLKVTIDIIRNSHQIFHFAFDGTAPDNDRWIKGKVKVVTLFNRSSYYVQTMFESMGKTIEEEYHLDSFKYLPSGGSFPVIIKNVGVVGSITVSGLAPEDDHALVVKAIAQYLNDQS